MRLNQAINFLFLAILRRFDKALVIASDVTAKNISFRFKCLDREQMKYFLLESMTQNQDFKHAVIEAAQDYEIYKELK